MDREMSERLRVLIVEDQWMLADAFRLLLVSEDDIALLPVAADTTAALEICARTCPDVVMLDADGPDVHRVALAVEIARTCPAARIVMLSAIPDPELSRRAAEVGAFALVSRQQAAEDLAGTLRRAAAERSGSGTDLG